MILRGEERRGVVGSAMGERIPELVNRGVVRMLIVRVVVEVVVVEGR